MADNGKQNWWRVLLIAGLWIGLLWVGYVLYLLRGETPGPVAAPTPTPALIDLWDVYGQARAAAQVQEKDAQLVSASTQWQATSAESLSGGSSNWSFVFYSPASSVSLDVVANAGTAQVVNQTQVRVAPETMAGSAGQAVPRDALLVFLAYGGRPFLDEHPRAIVDLHLAAGDEGGVVWTIVALDPKDERRSLLSVRIDAETMQVLSD